jgi:hypothetical protein
VGLGEADIFSVKYIGKEGGYENRKMHHWNRVFPFYFWWNRFGGDEKDSPEDGDTIDSRDLISFSGL